MTYELLAPGNVASYSDIYNTWFAPIKGKLKHVTHNYVTVFTRRSADVFDDWTQVVNNWSVMAQALTTSILSAQLELLFMECSDVPIMVGTLD